MIISISAEIEQLQNNNIYKREICKNYPGSEWAFFLNEKIKKNHIVVTSDVATSKLNKGIWTANEIYVIQHMNDITSKKLVDMGANPFIILSFESPLYQGYFYDHSLSFIKIFKHKLLFDGLIKNLMVDVPNFHQIRFPSFSSDDNLDVDFKNKINKVIFVSSNQYIHYKGISEIISLDDVIWFARRVISEFRYGSNVIKSISHSDNQLHEKRLELLSSLVDLNFLDLYGKGWDSYNNLPRKWKRTLLRLLGDPRDRSVNNKIGALSKYRYCLCVENFQFHGYITEKIIHSIVAKSVPIYYGAPNITQYIPADCFIDIRDFKGTEQLYDYIYQMDEDSYQKMINAGQKYLNSKYGKLHSYEGFSDYIANLINMEF